ncbi:MAG: saccharopine dehydrogenase NADP-binding domain-containing protein [Myxococcota bacterium]
MIAVSRKKKRPVRPSIVVVGGAGAMGRITVRDLVETLPPDLDVVVADHNAAAARKLATSHRPQRSVRAAGVDVEDPRSTARMLSRENALAVIGAIPHQLNLPLMQAALDAGVHYCDLGGLFHHTRQQLKLHARFEKKGLLALVGMGAAPGVVNVLARWAADEMEEVHEIHVAVGTVDRSPERNTAPLAASYSIQTILDEANLPAAVFTGGDWEFIEPMSGEVEVDFGPPVGKRRPACTLHSEVATLPLSYRHKGVQEVSFRIAFQPELVEKLRFLRALGISSSVPITVGRGRKARKVVPRDVLETLLARVRPARTTGVPDEYEVLRAVVRGMRAGRAAEDVLECHCPGIPEWGFGVDVDTGCPPSIAMQLLLKGVITARGVLPPEQAVPCDAFFRELGKRGMRVQRIQRAAIAAA